MRLEPLVFAAVLSACSLHTVKDDRAPVMAAPLPERFSELEVDGEVFVDEWWTLFGDGELDKLVGLALSDNFDLKRSLARIAQAEALMRAAGSTQVPSVTANAGVSGARNVFNLGEPLGVRSNEAANYTLGVSASWEIDLFNRLGHTADAAELDLAATHEDKNAIALVLAGRVTDLYLQAVGERALIDLLDAQETSARKLVELVELRFGQGLAALNEVYAQRQQLATIAAQRPLAQSRLAVFSHQLATLLGRPPSTLPLADVRALPELPPSPKTGLPSEVLMRRPDVRAALLRVTAADHRIGAAIAAQYPSISLSASTGFQSPDLLDLFSSWVWNLAANLIAPLFDGGRRSAEVDRTRAVLEDLVLAYGQTTLTAVTEVESALAQEARQRQHIERLEEQLALARLASSEVEARYVNGLSNQLEVLTAQRSLQQSEQSMLQARRQLLAFRVQLHRALGGTWMAKPLETNKTNTDRGAP